jgi:hypothetical protein
MTRLSGFDSLKVLDIEMPVTVHIILLISRFACAQARMDFIWIHLQVAPSPLQ